MDPEIIQGGLMQNLGMDEGTAYRYAAEISASPELYGDVLAKIGLSDGFQARFRAANPRPAPYNPEAESESRQRELGAYQDPIRKWAVETLTGFGVPAFTQYNLLGAAEMAPGPGDVMAVQDAALATGRAYDNPTLGNIGEAAGLGLAAGVGAIPLAGDVFGPLIKTGLGLGTKAAGGRAIDALTAGASKDILGQATQEVGRTDPLMMVHNQYQAALPKTSTLGGIPGPSAAITKPDIGLAQFGDISWIFDPEYAKRMSGGQTFARDAYTPRSPYVQPSFSLQARKAVSEIAGENNPNTVFGQRLLADKGFPDDILASFVNEVPSWADRENLAALYGIKPDQVDDRFAENLKQQLFLDLRDRNAPVKYKMRQETRYDSRQVDATNAKMLREMFASGARGGEYGPINFNRALALVTPELRTIKQVREQSGNIKRVTPTEYARATDEAEKLYTNIYDRIYELSKNNSELASDAAKDIFRFGRVRDKNLIGIIGSDLGSEFSGDVARFEKMAKEIPTEYFEKKFTKAVPYTAFKGAIIPEDAGPLVTETLEKAGIKHIETYRTPGEREAAFSRFPELLFSAAGAGGIFLASQKPERTDSPDGT
jgi:hypothetical protein